LRPNLPSLSGGLGGSRARAFNETLVEFERIRCYKLSVWLLARRARFVNFDKFIIPRNEWKFIREGHVYGEDVSTKVMRAHVV
jgi:hypothetical protein